MKNNFKWKDALDHNFLSLLFVIGILVIFAVCRCGKDETEAANQMATPQVKAPENKMTAVAEELPEPNHYLVKLSWQTVESSKPFTLYRKGKSAELTELAKLDAKENHFNDESIVAGEQYQYFLTNGLDTWPNVLLRTVITVPKDQVITGESHLKEIRGFNRLYFLKDSVLRTGGQDVFIEVNEIFSIAGTIETFPKKTRALQNGRNGGVIRVSAKQLVGNLFIEARGEAGGDGRDGLNGIAGTSGQPGRPGEWGMNPALLSYLTREYVESLGEGMRRFLRPPGHIDWITTRRGIPLYICATPPTTGGPGENGGAGTDGGPGGKGGDSASVMVNISEDSPFKVTISTDGGAFGLGGRPGKGGAPGPGGAAGARDAGHRCNPAEGGASGQPGLDGHPGTQGVVGVQKPVCLKIGSKSFYDCDKFQQNTGGLNP